MPPDITPDPAVLHESGRPDPLRRRLETRFATAADRWRPFAARVGVSAGLLLAMLRLRLGALVPRFLVRPVVRWMLAPALILVGSVVFGVHHLYADRRDVPALEAFVRFQPASIGEVYDSRGEILIELAREYRRVVEYPDIPPVVRNAILAAEDKNFFAHSGIDYGALPRVVWKTMTGSAAATWSASREAEALAPSVVFPQGGSTLTQQLVRGYFLRHLTSQEDGGRLITDGFTASLAAKVLGIPATNKLTRKIEEIRLSLWLEEEMARRYGSRPRAKEEIFARYASFIYMGNGRYGVAAASEYYFGRPLSSYRVEDAGRAALLAGITKSPRDYAPGPGNMERARRRRDHILGLMVRDGTLSGEVGRQCAAERIQLAARSRVKTEAPAVVENVFEELKRSGGDAAGVEALIEGRIRVHTTVDNRIQRVVNEALEAGLKAYERRHPRARGEIQGSVVVLANDGRILAEAGGRQVYRDRYTRYSDYNRVTDSRRQPGSAMKPLVYLAAFHHGLALDHTAFDEPVSVPTGTNRPAKWIHNYDGEFKGPIPVRQALAESRNAATIRIAGEVGIDEIIALARDLGIHTPLQPYITTALGASEVQLLELANTYRALASGIVTEPYVVQKVTDASGSVLREGGRPARPLPVSHVALAEIQEGLRGVVRLPGGTAHALASREFGIPVMGKTGTSSDFRDALFVGSTYGPTGITVAVRIGFDDNREMASRETGGRAALPVFRDIVAGVYGRDLIGPPPGFPEEMESRITDYLQGSSGNAERDAEVPAEETLPALQVRLAALAITPPAVVRAPTVRITVPAPLRRARRDR